MPKFKVGDVVQSIIGGTGYRDVVISEQDYRRKKGKNGDLSNYVIFVQFHSVRLKDGTWRCTLNREDVYAVSADSNYNMTLCEDYMRQKQLDEETKDWLS